MGRRAGLLAPSCGLGSGPRDRFSVSPPTTGLGTRRCDTLPCRPTLRPASHGGRRRRGCCRRGAAARLLADPVPDGDEGLGAAERSPGPACHRGRRSVGGPHAEHARQRPGVAPAGCPHRDLRAGQGGALRPDRPARGCPVPAEARAEAADQARSQPGAGADGTVAAPSPAAAGAEDLDQRRVVHRPRGHCAVREGRASRFEKLVYVNAKMADLCAEARPAARTGPPVLIHGETSTGKELLARAIHLTRPGSIRRCTCRTAAGHPTTRCIRSCSGTSAAPSPARSQIAWGCPAQPTAGPVPRQNLRNLATPPGEPAPLSAGARGEAAWSRWPGSLSARWSRPR